MCLAKWFNAKFCEWNKGQSQKRCFWNLFRAMKSMFLCILLNENHRLKAKPMETKFIYCVMNACIPVWMHAFLHALSLNSEFLIKRNLFPAFLTIQIVQSSAADFVPPQTVESTEKGFKDVRAHCYCASLVRTLYLTWHAFQAPASSRNLICEYFCWMLGDPHFFPADHFLFWFFPLY